MRKSPGVEASPTGSRKEPLLDPIQFILQDHDRQLEICSGLEKLISASEAEPIAEWAVSLLSFLTRDLPLHVKDEELDLFPRLTSRRPPESNLGDILDQLVTEHRGSRYQGSAGHRRRRASRVSNSVSNERACLL
jgi:hypothetical protein